MDKNSAARAHTYFGRIGDRVEGEWHAVSYDDRELPRIAERVLLDDPPHANVDPKDVIRWALTAHSLGPQPNADARFGEPPITVYAGRRFYIEVLFWFNGTTAIHQHGFDGAFSVLAGSSLHSTYHFREHDRTSVRLLVGDVVHETSELLRAGAVRRIVAGQSLIHSLFHLDRPSVSVVVRSFTASDAGVQYNYLPPYLAIDPFDTHIWNQRANDYLVAAIKMNDVEAPELLRTAAKNADDLGAYHLLSDICSRAGAVKQRLDLGGAPDAAESEEGDAIVLSMRDVAVELAYDRFGPFADPILKSLDEAWRKSELVEARRKVLDARHRYFLALLINVPNRAGLLELVHDAYPESDPVDRVCGWLGDLTRGSSPLLNYSIGEDALVAVDGLLRDLPVERVVRRLAEKHGRTLGPNDVEQVKAALDDARQVPFLRPLFMLTPPPTLENVLSSPPRSLGAAAR